MQTRRDQAQAYGFVARRLSAAVMGAEPNTPDPPMRRLGRASILGVMAAVLAVAGATVYGYLRPGGDTGWQQSGVLVVERETSTRYLYTAGVLHPVLNYTSARLALGTATPETRSVSGRSLAGVPRGAPVGIAGAPDDLPPAGALVGPPWTVCTRPARDPAGTLVATTVFGAEPRGARAATGTGPAVLPAGSGLLAAAPSGQLWLLWQGHRLPLGSAAVRSVLGYDAVVALPVDAALLSLIPPGPALAPITIPPGNAPGVAGAPGVPGAVYQTDGGQSYLLLPSGLAPLSPLQAGIQLAGLAYPSAQRIPVRIPAGAVAGSPVAPSTVDGRTPASPPAPVPAPPDTTAVCVALGDPADTVALSVRAAAATTLAGYAEPVDATGGPLADQVALPAGSAALVRAQPAPGVTGGTVYLLTGAGVKYPLGDADTAGLLGYPGVTPTPLPPAWVQLLATGPTLSRAAATRTVPVAP